MKPRAAARRAPALACEEFEPRILYSADLAPLLLAGVADAAAVEAPVQRQAAPVAVPAVAEIAFVDMGVAGADALVDDLQAQAAAGRAIEVLRIGADEDGIVRIGEALASRHDIAAVHLLSHGADGVVQLGSARLDAATLVARAGELAAWSGALTADADLLLYGCDVAAQADGRALIGDLAALTGADVAASDDATGALASGADWTLEHRTGAIDALLAPGLAAQQRFAGTLGLLAADSFSGTGSLDGQGGGIGWGDAWSGAWSSGDPMQLVAGSLYDPTRQLAVAGNAVLLQVAPILGGSTHAERHLGQAVGSNGTTTWMSFVVMPDELSLGATMGLAFGGDNGGDVAFVGYRSGQFVIDDANSADSAVASATPQASTAALVVVKIEHKAGDDMLTLYVDPIPGQATPTSPGASIGTLDLGSFDRIAMAGSNAFTGANHAVLDELRIGQSFADVVPAMSLHSPVVTSNGGGASASIGVAENTAAVTTVSATDVDAASSLSYSIGGSDAARFVIGTSSGVLRFAAAPDFEAPADADADNVYRVDVTVSDGVNTDTQSLSVTVGNVLERPTAHDDAVTVPSHTPTLIDVLANDSHGDGGTLKVIDASTPGHGSVEVSGGTLRYTGAPGYSGSDSLRYRIAEGSADLQHYWGLDGNATDSVGAAAGSLNGGPTRVAGAFGGGLQFDGVDDRVQINDFAHTGEFTLSVWFRVDDNHGTGYRFLAAHGGVGNSNSLNIYFVEDATTGNGGANDVLRTRVRDANDADDIDGLDIAAASLADGQWHQYTLTTQTGVGSKVYIDGVQRAASSRGGDVLNPGGTFVIGANTVYSGGTFFDGALDSVALHGRTLSAAEVAAGFAGDSTVGEVDLSVAAGGAVAPVIASNGGGASAALTVAENGKPVTSVTAIDLDADALVYSISGVDAGRFKIDAVTGELRFEVAPDFEAAGDAGADNVYQLTVSVSDGSLVDTQAVTITVLDVNEAPVITSNGGAASAAVDFAATGGSTAAVASVVAADPDGLDVLQFSIVGGADAARFHVDPISGVLTFRLPPDADAPTDADHDKVYEVVVRAGDGQLFDQQLLAVTVTGSAPTITSHGGGASATVTLPENGLVVTTFTGQDADPGAALRYAISGGADAARFRIDALTGVLSFVAAPNFEAPQDAGTDNVYDVTVQLGDGTLTDRQTLAVRVVDVDEAPLATGVDLGTLAEDGSRVITQAALLADAVDAEGDALTARHLVLLAGRGSLVDHADGRWSFVAEADWTGAVRLGFEVDDGTTRVAGSARLRVEAVNDAPRFSGFDGAPGAALGVDENTSAVATLVAHDSEAGPLRFSLSGGADAARFHLDATTGVLRFVAAPDREHALDADGDNRYELVVGVSDGALQARQALTIVVGNVDEAPAFEHNVLLLSDHGVRLEVQAIDPDSPSSALVFQAQAVVGGHFEQRASATAPAQVVTQFSQADLDAGRVRFVRDGSGVLPQMTLKVSDGTSQVQAAPTPVIDITLPPAPPPPPVPPPPAPPAPATKPPSSEADTSAGGHQLPAPAPAAPGTAQTSPARPSGTPSTGTASAPSDAPAAPTPTPTPTPSLETLLGSAGREGAEPAIGLVVAAPPSAPAPPPRSTDPVLASVAVVPVSAPLVWLSDGAAPEGRATPLLQDLGSALRDQALGRQLDQLRERHEHERAASRQAVGSSSAVATGMSVGYVLWLARGGALMASVMSALPAWANLDPLPVLSQLRRGAKAKADSDSGAEGGAAEADDDAVETLFNAVPAPAVPAPAVPSAGAPRRQPEPIEEAT